MRERASGGGSITRITNNSQSDTNTRKKERETEKKKRDKKEEIYHAVHWEEQPRGGTSITRTLQKPVVYETYAAHCSYIILNAHGVPRRLIVERSAPLSPLPLGGRHFSYAQFVRVGAFVTGITSGFVLSTIYKVRRRHCHLFL